MRLYYDFHIHSALSPCADRDMTVNNIMQMSRLKGLDAVSVCDHNCAANLRAAEAAAGKAGVLFLPGIEVNTAEEVHVLAYFKDIESACGFGEMIYGALPDIKNNEQIFGQQLVMDENDNVLGKMEKLLISAVPFSIGECVRLIGEYGGCAVPAHINREANSVLGNLGFLPADIRFTALEVMEDRPAGEDLSKYTLLHSSDAHFLGDISEKKNYIEEKNRSAASIVDTLLTNL